MPKLGIRLELELIMELCLNSEFIIRNCMQGALLLSQAEIQLTTLPNGMEHYGILWLQELGGGSVRAFAVYNDELYVGGGSILQVVFLPIILQNGTEPPGQVLGALERMVVY